MGKVGGASTWIFLYSAAGCGSPMERPDERPLDSFPLASTHRAKLSNAGFVTVEDIKLTCIGELSKELDISHSEALEIIRVITEDGSQQQSSGVRSSYHAGCSALELLKEEQMKVPIVTFCAEIDNMLGGGVFPGKITEFCGAPGVGKTQMSMQLAVDATIPSAFGGAEGEVVYIDTEGSFIVERVAEIANAAVRHVGNVAKSNEEPSMLLLAEQFTLEHVLSSIHTFRCHSYLQLIAVVNILPDFISNHKKVKLVVIDSIASHFRHQFSDMRLRNRILGGLAQNLIKMANQSDLAVVLTNQMTTRFGSSGERAQLTPALGESWGHASTVRVILYWEGDRRLALLYKSPTHKETTVAFSITQDGVRDAADAGSKTELAQPVISSQSLDEDTAALIADDPCFEDNDFSTTKLTCELDHNTSANKRPRLDSVESHGNE